MIELDISNESVKDRIRTMYCDSRMFQRSFDTGSKVKLNLPVIEDSAYWYQVDPHKYKDMTGEVLKCWSYFHAFTYGSAFSHTVKWENGDVVDIISSDTILGIDEPYPTEKEFPRKNGELDPAI